MPLNKRTSGPYHKVPHAYGPNGFAVVGPHGGVGCIALEKDADQWERNLNAAYAAGRRSVEAKKGRKRG